MTGVIDRVRDGKSVGLAGAVRNGVVRAGFHADAAFDTVVNTGCYGLTISKLVDINGAVFNTRANTSTLIVVHLYRHISR